MNKTRIFTISLGVILVLAALAAVRIFGSPSPVQQGMQSWSGTENLQDAQSQVGLANTGAQYRPSLTAANCYSANYHSATNCDRVASGSPASVQPNPPATAICFSAARHAATDCDRIASGSTSP